MSSIRSRQGGFTLIELVVVIVLLGILGAVATARFQDLSGAANAAALEGVTAEIQSASAINYAAAVVPGGPGASVDISVAPPAGQNDCALIVAGLMQTGAIPTGYTAAGTLLDPVAPNPPLDCVAAGDTRQCPVTQTATGNVSNVNLLCTGP